MWTFLLRLQGITCLGIGFMYTLVDIIALFRATDGRPPMGMGVLMITAGMIAIRLASR